MGVETRLSQKQARDLLGVSASASAAEIRSAFRQAAKAAHPDRPGGGAERFRAVVEAYHLLDGRAPKAERPRPPVSTAPTPIPLADTLVISPVIAMTGGDRVHTLRDGRQIRVTLPEGLRTGDRVRAGEVELEVKVANEGDMIVRGDDLWITVNVEPRLLNQGGRIAVETPLGRRIVWISRKAGARGLVRLVDQGLPARGDHRQGHLFLRLTPRRTHIDSAARTLLRRFAAAWAA